MNAPDLVLLNWKEVEFQNNMLLLSFSVLIFSRNLKIKSILLDRYTKLSVYNHVMWIWASSEIDGWK